MPQYLCFWSLEDKKCHESCEGNLYRYLIFRLNNVSSLYLVFRRVERAPALEVCHSSTVPPCGCGNIASVDHLSDNDWLDNDFSIDTDLVVHFLVHTIW